MSDYQPTPPSSAPYAQSGYAPVQRTNVLAIVGFVLSFIVSLAGLIVSIVALRQIKRTGEQGRGLALAGVIISIVGIVFYVLVIGLIIIGGVIASQNGYSTGS